METEKRSNWKVRVQLADERIGFLGKTYGLLALCIAAGSIGAYASLGMAYPYEHPFIMLFAMIGGIFAVQALRHKPGLNLIALLGFGALTGMAIAPLVGFVAAKSGMLVTQAFMTTAVAAQNAEQVKQILEQQKYIQIQGQGCGDVFVVGIVAQDVGRIVQNESRKQQHTDA